MVWRLLPLKLRIRPFACRYRCLFIARFCRRDNKAHRFNTKYFCSKLKMKDTLSQPWVLVWRLLPLKLRIRPFACRYRCLFIARFCRRDNKAHRFNTKYFCSKLKMKDTCGKGHDNWSTWTSTEGKKSRYCKRGWRTCRQMRAQAYLDRKKKIGSHTKKEWEDKLIQYDKCPSCKRSWSEIKPSKGQAKYHITKDHITPLSKGGTDNIDNIQPLCYQCNFKKGSKHDYSCTQKFAPSLTL